VSLLAIDAIGEGLLGPSRAAIAAFTLGLLLTFLFVRVNTRLIRANVSWWFHDIESDGGLHVHHVVIGVVVMVASGLGLIAAQPEGLWLQLLAFAFGAGVGLTLDEFALILRLQDVYWAKEGRLSVDAVIVAVCVGLLLVLGQAPLGNAFAVEASSLAADVMIAVVITIDVGLAVICLLKGKLWTGFFAVFIPVVGWVGAIRVARPSSPWAHRRYGDKPRRLAKARRREERIDTTWRAWRTALYDLLAGKPHLPSIAAPAAGTAAGADAPTEAPGAGGGPPVGAAPGEPAPDAPETGERPGKHPADEGPGENATDERPGQG
jgi:lysyl-tRNA synthetase class 2